MLKKFTRAKVLYFASLPLFVIALDFAATWALRKVTVSPGFIRIKSSVFHHTLAPLCDEAENRFHGSTHLITNSLGFKDSEKRDVSLKMKGKKRILFMGDSFTEGVGVSYGDTFVGRFADRVLKSGVEVLNGAVLSYSPIIYYRKTKYWIAERGLEVSDVVVFIDLSDALDELKYCFDDSENVIDCDKKTLVRKRTATGEEKRVGEVNPIKFQLTRNTILTRFIIEQFKHFIYGPFGLPRLNANWTVDENLYEWFARDGMAIGMRHMDQLAEFLKNRNITLTVGVYPWPEQLRAHDLNSIEVTAWRDWAKKRGVPFIDLFPVFLNEEDPVNVLRECYRRDNPHWNSEGHRRAAERLLSLWNGTHFLL